MTEHTDTVFPSPVPAPGPDAAPPALYRGIYGMPSFVSIPTADLDASVRFWTEGLGFFELFRMPGVVHLRRWAFQDVLLSPADEAPAEPPAMRATFACVLSQVDGIVEACRALDPASVAGPVDTPWNTRDVEVVTPERARVVFTAGKPLDPSSRMARDLAAAGIDIGG